MYYKKKKNTKNPSTLMAFQNRGKVINGNIKPEMVKRAFIKKLYFIECIFIFLLIIFSNF